MLRTGIPALEGSSGRVGITFLPGKKHDGYSGPHWRDLELDLARLRALGVDALSLLVEDAELDRFLVPELPDVMAAQGPELVRFPVSDGLDRSSMTAACVCRELAFKQGIDLATEIGELCLQGIPDQPIIHLGVAVDQDVPEVDDGAVLADPGRELPVELGELRKCFPDDLEFTLDGRSQHGLAEVVGKLLASGELL